MNSQILMVKTRIFLLNSNFSIWKYQEIHKGVSLVILKELDLTNKSDGAATAVATVAAAARSTEAARATGTASGYDYWKIRNQAKEELKKTGKIKGFEVLNLRSLDKLWISHYDLEALQ